MQNLWVNLFKCTDYFFQLVDIDYPVDGPVDECVNESVDEPLNETVDETVDVDDIQNPYLVPDEPVEDMSSATYR